MGNELFKEYVINKTPLMSTGFQSLWKVYSGYHKERKQDVCIFFLDKKGLKSMYKSKRERREIISLLKRDATNLMKYRNDYFLQIIEPLIEDKGSMGFITEPFEFNISKWCEQVSPSKLEIKLMIKEVCHGISHLHKAHSIVHCDINSNSIYVTKSNRVKISGLAFSQTEGKATQFYSHKITPSLNYASPEVIIDHMVKYHSDTFSIGLLIFLLLKRYLNDKNKHFLNSPQEIEAYRDQILNYDKTLRKLDFIEEDNKLLLQLLAKDALSRPSIEQMLSMPWFDDPKLKSLYFIENFETNDYAKNIAFIEKLPQYISYYENRVIEKRILPSLLQVLSKENLMSAVLPCIFAICDLPMIKIKFETCVWPKVKQLFKLKSLPASTLHCLISKIALFGSKISEKEFCDNFLNLISKALDSNVLKIQSAVVENLNYLMKKFSHETFQEELYPRLIQLLTSTTSNNIKARILLNLKEIYSSLDHNAINESLLNALSSIKVAESSSDVCMEIVSIYEEIAKIVSVESFSSSIIPKLITLLISGNITKDDFERINQLILAFLDRIRSFREKDLCEQKKQFPLNEIVSSKIIIETEPIKINQDKDFFTDFFSDFFNGIKGEVRNLIEPIKQMTKEKTKAFDILPQNDLSFDEEKKRKNSLGLFAPNVSVLGNVLQFTEGDHVELKDTEKHLNHTNNYYHHSHQQDALFIGDLDSKLDYESIDNANNLHSYDEKRG